MSQFFQTITDSNLPPDVATQYTADLATIAKPSGNNLNVFGGTGIRAFGSGSTITFNVINGGFTWIETSVSLLATPQQGIFCNANDVVITLPTTANANTGSTIYIYADVNPDLTPPGHNIVIQANNGQFIEIGSVISSSGGTATHNARGDLVQLIFRTTDSTWHSFSVMGNWTIT